MGEKRRRKMFIKICSIGLFITVAFCAVFLGFEQTRAWLLEEEKAEADVAISDFKIQGQAFFGGAPTDLTSISLDSTQSNYLGNLKYVLSYEGISPAYVRVRILEQWVDRNTNVIKDMPFTSYMVSGGAISGAAPLGDGLWYDNRENDNCYYYAENQGMFSADSSISGSAITVGKRDITLFDGVDLTGITGSDTNTEVKIIIEVEAVQPNRYREFWNIGFLPWETLPEPTP